jgi:Amt family ammonium transporter
VHVAIDDFGTGYSSLSSLRDLPADIIKIDRSFVAGLTTEDDSEAIVRAVLAMAHATGRTVVAEGVETVEQAHRLRALSCDRLQGYLFSKPLMPIDFDPNRHYALPPVSQQEPGRRS